MSIFKVLSIFLVTLSLLSSGLWTSYYLPSIPKARGVGSPVEPWYPAGPSSNTLQVSIFAGQGAEFAALVPATSIDLMDLPLTPAQGGACVGPNYYLTPITNFCYTTYWQQVIDSPARGTFNFFTSLNAYSTGACVPAGCALPVLPQSPPLATPSAGSIRQGFAGPTTGLNPYTAPVTLQNSYILDNVFDRLYRVNPADSTQLIDWMTVSSSLLPNTQLTYLPPPGTTITLRSTLRQDIFWHDNQRFTAWDAAFTYMSLVANAAPQLPPELVCPGAGCLFTGVTVLSSSQIDINLSNLSFAVSKERIGSVTIIPGHIWSTCTPIAAWNTFTATTTPQTYPIGSGGCLSAAAGLIPLDPLTAINPNTGKSGVLIGSGPWVCQNTGTNFAVPVGTLGTGCTSSNTQTPPVGGSLTLTRYACSLTTGTCFDPASSLLMYFRSSGNLALYFWTGNTGIFIDDFLNTGIAVRCFGNPLGTPGCTHWQEGIGNPGNGNQVGLVQVSVLVRFVSINWVPPFFWSTGPTPTGIGIFHSVLYERTSAALVPAYILNPKPVAGCMLPANQPPVSPMGYPSGGGYDC